MVGVVCVYACAVLPSGLRSFAVSDADAIHSGSCDCVRSSAIPHARDAPEVMGDDVSVLLLQVGGNKTTACVGILERLKLNGRS